MIGQIGQKQIGQIHLLSRNDNYILDMQNIDLNEIRAMPIEEVAAKLGIEVGRHKALCPFHQDRHPSLHFDIKRNRYKCFSCGASGNVIDLVMRYMNVSFKEAVEWNPPPQTWR